MLTSDDHRNQREGRPTEHPYRAVNARGRKAVLLNGLDISNHNWPLDPTVVPGDFIIMKATEGKGWRDQRYTEYGYLAGWSHRLDLNAFFGTADDWRAIADSGRA